jgi:ubiquitin
MIGGNDIESLKNLFGSSARDSRFPSLAMSRHSKVGASDVKTSSIGEGSSIKQWLSSNVDFSVANTSKISRFGPIDTPLTSKMQSAIDPKRSKKAGSKKKELTESLKESIIAQLDLNNPEAMRLSKLGKNLEDSRKHQERIANKFNAQNLAHLKSLKEFTCFEALRCKELQVRPLNYQFDFKRLTQIFGRQLQIKYYNKNQRAH